MFVTRPNMEPKRVYLPLFDWDGGLSTGTAVVDIKKDTIIIHMPEGSYGMKVSPAILITGWCPVCQAEVDAAHIIEIHETVKRQYNICSLCTTEFRPNPLIFPQAIVLYDLALDEKFLTNLPPEYIEMYRETVRKMAAENKEEGKQ